MSHKKYNSNAERQAAYRRNLAAKKAGIVVTVATNNPLASAAPSVRLVTHAKGHTSDKTLRGSPLRARGTTGFVGRKLLVVGDWEAEKVLTYQRCLARVAVATMVHAVNHNCSRLTACGRDIVIKKLCVDGATTCGQCLRIKEAVERKAARKAKVKAFQQQAVALEPVTVPVESEVQTLVDMHSETSIEDWHDFISRINGWWSKRLGCCPGECSLFGGPVPADWPVAKLWNAMRADNFAYCYGRLTDQNLERVWQKQRKELNRNPSDAEFVCRWIVDEIVQEEKVS
jgi:hypothetical protein